MLITELKKLKLQSELVSIERDCHDEELTGLICGIDEILTKMHLFTCDGEYDGFTVFETSQITEVYWGNREHKAIALLVAQNGIVETPKFDSKIFQDLILEVSSNSDSVCFHSSNNEDLFTLGKIVQTDSNWFNVYTFGLMTYTPKNGHSFINLLFHTHQAIYSPKLNEGVYDYKTLQCI